MSLLGMFIAACTGWTLACAIALGVLMRSYRAEQRREEAARARAWAARSGGVVHPVDLFHEAAVRAVRAEYEASDGRPLR